MRLDPSRFDRWFAALNRGAAPFPWQRRLFRRWLCPEQASDAHWPRLVKLPTASGKTALIDLAVLGLAAGSPAARRRIIFVVDRRVVVDEATLRAEAIRERLRQSLHSSSDALYEVARSLLDLGGEEPLAVAALRGGIPADDGWARSPAQPAVVLSTVDQIGSRLLFRAYGGHGPRSWPIHAGLVGRDAVIIVDEAHCSAPFCETAHAIANRWQHVAEQPVGPDLLLVRMSATPGEGADFELDDEDRKDEILKLRLQASKTAELVNIKANREKSRAGLVEETIRRSQRLLDSMTGGVLGIVLNRVADARSVFEQLQIPENRKILLTGRARGWERDRLLEQWMPLLRADSHEQADSPLAVIATQCIEVGANLDFDYLVTEIAPLDTLRQRFGRVDRLGRRNDRLQYLGDRAAMPGMILATAAQIEGDGNEAKFEDRVYGHALHRTWMWLNERGLADPRCVDFGIDAMDSILPEGEDLARLCQNVSRAFPLLPAYLDILAQTNPPPQPEPEIAAFLHGMTQAAPDVTLVWRRDLPENDPDLWPDRAALQPPVTGEGCPVPIWEFRRWLTGARPAEDSGDVEALAAEDEPNSGPGRVLRWRGPQDAKVLAGGDVAPGDTVIVPSAYGGCDAFGWNPASVAPVTDIGDAVAFDAGRRPVLRLAAITAESAQAAVSGLKSWAQGEEDAPDPREALERLASLPDVPQWLPTLARTLLADGRRRLIEASGAYAIAGRRSRGEDLSTSDDGSALGASVELMNHCDGVSDYAKRFAGALGLPETLVDDIGLAALMHDFGKADPRFQVWLYNGDHIAAALGGAVLAKSGENPRNRAAIRRARKRAGYPENGRHEAQSLALIQSRPEISAMANDWDLVRHLVASHHGFARPLLPVIADPEPVEVALDFNDLRLSCTSDHGLYKLDSGVGERYWRLTQRYGWWGLAWLETILRLADHRCSEVEQQ